MPRAIDVVLALGAEEETVQPFILSHGVNAIEPASEHLMHVALMTDIEDELVVRGGEAAVQRNGQLDHAEIRAEMAASLRKHLDQLVAHFLRKLRETFLRQRFHVGGRLNSLKQRHRFYGR